ncbi:enoyl-CoA hydratase-related protein [Sporichthya sp.]|uniref:enoyl-CoA hydratase-related protein n=1 Tax=Sporichthya sp. TaxID=65475 RepID=UPI00178DB1F1|nr:enoyl-CoA hydratase-related protein [Sporichthya sp.]MBA3742511.1 enoyl-CoA hydratase/isomerase family protein [Sporichthya sp.]
MAEATSGEAFSDTSGYTDVLYETDNGAAIITINRPHRYNAFRGRTVDELVHAFRRAWADPEVRCVIWTGAGDKAFCSGGDVKQRAETGDYGPTRDGILDTDYLHALIRDIPKPVIAAVNGVAIGGGHVFHVLCDISIAAEHAKFGQAGPRVGSFDAGYGTNMLSRLVGTKRAKEIWFFCRQYTAQEAKEMGLVNAVVPGEELMATAKAWAAELNLMSPTALRFLKASFNAETAHQSGFEKMAGAGLDLFVNSEEGAEGARAFAEKRPPEFTKYVGR